MILSCINLEEDSDAYSEKNKDVWETKLHLNSQPEVENKQIIVI